MSSRIMWATKEQIFTEADRIKELESEITTLREALEEIIALRDNQSMSYEKWELMVYVAVDALDTVGDKR